MKSSKSQNVSRSRLEVHVSVLDLAAVGILTKHSADSGRRSNDAVPS